MSRAIVSLAALLVAAFLPASAAAQDKWPSKPINIIVPWAAGGATDQNAAWYYADPKPAAGLVAGYIGFWHGVTIEAAHESSESTRPAGRDA